MYQFVGMILKTVTAATLSVLLFGQANAIAHTKGFEKTDQTHVFKNYKNEDIKADYLDRKDATEYLAADDCQKFCQENDKQLLLEKGNVHCCYHYVINDTIRCSLLSYKVEEEISADNVLLTSTYSVSNASVKDIREQEKIKDKRKKHMNELVEEVKKVNELKTTLKKQSKEIENLKIKITEQKATILDIENKKKEAPKLNNEIKNLKYKLNLKSEIEDNKKTYAEYKEQYDKIIQNIKKLEEEIKNLKDKQVKLQELKENREKVVDSQNEMDELIKDTKAKHKELKENRKEAHDWKIGMNELEKDLKDLDKKFEATFRLISDEFSKDEIEQTKRTSLEFELEAKEKQECEYKEILGKLDSKAIEKNLQGSQEYQERLTKIENVNRKIDKKKEEIYKNKEMLRLTVQSLHVQEKNEDDVLIQKVISERQRNEKELKETLDELNKEIENLEKENQQDENRGLQARFKELISEQQSNNNKYNELKLILIELKNKIADLMDYSDLTQE
jgi:chromosome segregation ATPase